MQRFEMAETAKVFSQKLSRLGQLQKLQMQKNFPNFSEKGFIVEIVNLFERKYARNTSMMPPYTCSALNLKIYNLLAQKKIFFKSKI